MQHALYGDAGFYRSPSAPGRHFRTSAHVGAAWAAGILELASRIDDLLGDPSDFAVVDVGAGGGELLHHLAEVAPSRWRLVGIDDVAPRPDGLGERIEWHAAPPARIVGLLIAVELLDVVPVDVVELTSIGPQLVEVDGAGNERALATAAPADLDWLARWWPVHEIGDRAEIGRTRDESWRSLCERLDRGVAVAIDYAADPEIHRGGTLAAYREGRQVPAVPDGSCDLTAHVLFESLADHGDVVIAQRDALAALGVNARRPRYDGDAGRYLAELANSGEVAELRDRDGLGGFTWLLHGCGVDPESALRQSTPTPRTSERTSSTHP